MPQRFVIQFIEHTKMKVVITGGTKGIGWAMVEEFAAHGFDIAICSRSQEDLTQRAQALNKQYPDQECITQVADMRRKADVIAFADLIKSSWKEIDILINNAGVFLPGEIAKEEDGQLETMIETNLYSAYYLTRALLPTMIPQKKGHIFNICSIASQIAYPNGGSYSISKFALLGFSKVLREELKEQGIRVTSILPGATWSNSWKGVDLPEDRLMQASDVAKTVYSAFTLSQSAVVEDIVLRPQLGDL